MHRKNKINNSILDNVSKGKKYIVPYLTFGFPTIENFKTIFLNIAKHAEIIEIGMPFSDPLADGIIIQTASTIALKNNVTLNQLLDTFIQLKNEHNSKLILMSYLNPCIKYGLEKMFSKMKEAGFIAVVFPDLPYNKDNYLKIKNNNKAIGIIYLVSTTTLINRAQEIMDLSNPFVYAVTVKGTTGERKQLPDELPDWLKKLKELSKTPVFAGFGISSPVHIEKIKDYADGFIVGSAIIKLIINNKSNEIIDFINKMKSVI